MPKSWIESLISIDMNLARCHKVVSTKCDVSPLSAAIRLVPFLPKGIVYAFERDGKVEFSGKSSGTLASYLASGTEISDSTFGYCKDHFVADLDLLRLHWWQLPEKISIDTPDNDRTWREVLDSILNDIGIDKGQFCKFKMSINGVIASANGTIKRQDGYCRDALVSAIIQRFVNRTEFSKLVNHEDFNTFIYKKSDSLVNMK